MLNKMRTSHNELDEQIEVGGNYFELIEFYLMRKLPGGREIKGIYGVNVVKVREVVLMPRINPLSSSVPGVAGIFELRGIPIPAVNLCTVLGDYNSQTHSEQQIIVTEFSQKRAGFIVHSTNRIRRVTWDKVLPASADNSSSITGMLLIENNEFLFILDLEKIIMQIESAASTLQQGGIISGSNYLNLEPAMPQRINRNAPGILLVDDSNLILNNVSKSLLNDGYRVIIAHNGSEALQKLEQSLQIQSPSGSIQAIITDLEMPQMDGITFTSKARARRDFDKIPIYLHTSLSGATPKEMGERAGVNGYFIKNDLITISQTLKRFFMQPSKTSA